MCTYFSFRSLHQDSHVMDLGTRFIRSSIGDCILLRALAIISKNEDLLLIVIYVIINMGNITNVFVFLRPNFKLSIYFDIFFVFK